MDAGLSIGVVWADQDVLEVEVAAWNGAFGGRTRLYLGIGGLAEAASQLEGFPTSAGDSRLLLLGAFGPEFAGGAMSLALSLSDSAGHARAQVVIEGDGEVAGTTETVTLVLPFEPARLEEFAAALGGLEAQRQGVAFLKATGS